MLQRIDGPSRILALALVATLGIPSVVFGQATVPGKRAGYVSIGYQYTDVQQHLFSDGQEGDFGRIEASTINFYVDYGLFEKFALSMNVPFVESRYGGPFPESSIDGGGYNGTIQDFFVSARYQLMRAPFFLTPILAVTIPSHNYETIGHTAVGRNLNELVVGFAAARLLNPLLSDAFLSAGYNYSWTEEFNGVGLDRSNMFVQAGYFVASRVTLSAGFNFQWAHDGIDWTQISTAGEFHEHDRLARASYTRLGGAISYSTFAALMLELSGGVTLSGENTHDARFIQLTTAWGFGGY